MADITNFLFQAMLEEKIGGLNEAGEEEAALGDATMPGQAQGQTNAADNPPEPPALGGDDATQGGEGDAEDPLADMEDFSMDPDGGNEEEEDLPDHPDGLPEPDEVGGGDTGENNLDGELNIHYNILQLSKMDRLMAKRKMYADYQSLRTSIRAFQHVIDENEVAIDADIRDYARNKATYLFTTLTDYIAYKLSYTSYEDNLQNFLIFSKALDDLMVYVNNRDEDKKRAKKETKERSEDFISDESKERTKARLDKEEADKEEQDLDNMSPEELGTSEEEPDEMLDSLDDHLDAVSDEVENEENGEENPEEEAPVEGEETEGEEPETDLELEELEGEEEEPDIDLDELENEEIEEEPETDIEEPDELSREPEDTDIDADDLEELPDEGPETDIDTDDIDEELDAAELEDLEIPDFDEEELEELDIEEEEKPRARKPRRSKSIEGEGSEDIEIPEFDIEDL